MSEDKIVSWICLSDDEITNSSSLAENWNVHGHSVKELTENDLGRYKEALAVQKVFEASIPSLDPENFENLEAALKVLCSTRTIPLEFCDVTNSFVVVA
jgi:hypothetical protein